MRCPECNCPDTNVYRTMQISSTKVRRYHTCRHCKFSFASLERIVPIKTKKTSKPKDDDDELYIIDDDVDSGV